jgi:HK97 family phage major capsid protein
MNITELNQKRGELVTQARAALEEINRNTDEARAAELDARHDTIMAEFDKLEARIAREERVATAEKSLIEREERSRRRQRPVDDTDEQRDGSETIEYRTVFAKAICGPLESLTPEERAVLKTGSTEFRAQTGATTTAGGFLVPTTLADVIVRSMLAWGPMYDPGVTTEMMTSSGNPIKIPTINDTAVTAVAHTEGTALTDTNSKDVTIGQQSLDAFAFDTQFVRWSWELDMDSIFGMEALLGDLLGERLGRIANSQLTVGTGSSAPNGIVTASTLGRTAAAVAAITFDEIIDLEHSVDPAYRLSPKARFMMNDSTLAAVRKLKDGQGNYLWQSGNVQAGIPGTINGRPFSINQAMASLATGNRVMVFGDFGKYFVRKVGTPVIGVMRERFWPDLGIAGLIRFDGELADTAAVKHLRNA